MEDSTPFLDDETFLKLAPDSEIATLLANMEDGPVTINIAEPVSVKEEEAVKQTPPSTTALTIPDQLTVAAINSMVTVSNVTDAMINEYRAITAALDKDKEDTRSDTCPPRFFVGKQVLIHSSVSDEDRLQMWGLLFYHNHLNVQEVEAVAPETKGDWIIIAAGTELETTIPTLTCAQAFDLAAKNGCDWSNKLEGTRPSTAPVKFEKVAEATVKAESTTVAVPAKTEAVSAAVPVNAEGATAMVPASVATPELGNLYHLSLPGVWMSGSVPMLDSTTPFNAITPSASPAPSIYVPASTLPISATSLDMGSIAATYAATAPIDPHLIDPSLRLMDAGYSFTNYDALAGTYGSSSLAGASTPYGGMATVDNLYGSSSTTTSSYPTPMVSMSDLPDMSTYGTLTDSTVYGGYSTPYPQNSWNAQVPAVTMGTMGTTHAPYLNPYPTTDLVSRSASVPSRISGVTSSPYQQIQSARMRSASASIAVPSHDQSQGHVHSHSPSVYRRRVISESALPLNAPPLQFPQVDEEQPVTGANGKLDMPEGWTDEDVANYIFRKLLAYEWNPFEKIKKSREMFFDEYESAHNFPDGGDPEQFCKRYEARFIRQLPEYGSAPHGTPRTHNWNKDNLDNIVWYSKNMHNWTERSKQTAFFEDFKEVYGKNPRRDIDENKYWLAQRCNHLLKHFAKDVEGQSNEELQSRHEERLHMFHNKKENDKLENQRVKKKQREDRNAAKAVAKAKEEHEKRMRRAEKAALAATKKAQPPSKKRSNEDMDIAPEIYAPPLKRSRTPPPFSTAPSHHLGDMFGGSLFGYP